MLWSAEPSLFFWKIVIAVHGQPRASAKRRTLMRVNNKQFMMACWRTYIQEFIILQQFVLWKSTILSLCYSCNPILLRRSLSPGCLTKMSCSDVAHSHICKVLIYQRFNLCKNVSFLPLLSPLNTLFTIALQMFSLLTLLFSNSFDVELFYTEIPLFLVSSTSL